MAAVKQDMEDIRENGGFRFKETVMSGDPLEEGEELRNVLGLRCDTKKDEICVDVKLNYGEKVKRAYQEEDAPLSDPESALPQVFVRDTAQENVMNAHEETRLFLVVVNQPKNITTISTWQPIIDKHFKNSFLSEIRITLHTLSRSTGFVLAGCESPLHCPDPSLLGALGRLNLQWPGW